MMEMPWLQHGKLAICFHTRLGADWKVMMGMPNLLITSVGAQPAIPNMREALVK